MEKYAIEIRVVRADPDLVGALKVWDTKGAYYDGKFNDLAWALSAYEAAVSAIKETLPPQSKGESS